MRKKHLLTLDLVPENICLISELVESLNLKNQVLKNRTLLIMNELFEELLYADPKVNYVTFSLLLSGKSIMQSACLLMYYKTLESELFVSNPHTRTLYFNKNKHYYQNLRWKIIYHLAENVLYKYCHSYCSMSVSVRVELNSLLV